MKPPVMSDEELDSFLKGRWVAKIATISQHMSIRITSVWYENRGSHILMNTSEKTTLVGNLRRNSAASLLIDSGPDAPYRGVHYMGYAEVGDEGNLIEDIGKLWTRYFETEEAAMDYARTLSGKQVFVRFYPKKKETYDYSKT